MKISTNNNIRIIFSRIKYFILTGTMVGTLLCAQTIKEEIELSQTKEITADELKKDIYTSSLTDEEKKYLYNSDFFIDVLKTINDSKISTSDLRKKIEKINIQSYEDDDTREGYYTHQTQNTIYISDYTSLNYQKKDTLAHEFIHLCQSNNCEYNMILEATAEIISKEYYDLTTINSYINEVKNLKVLMEIIGPRIIWNYVLTNDKEPLEKALKKYLDDVDYDIFISCLSINQNDEQDRKIKSTKISNLLDIMYYSKYQKNINDDLVISLIRNYDISLRRYYFNYRYINHDNSFYRDGEEYEDDYLSFEEAEKENYIIFFDGSDQISYHEYLQKKDNKNVVYIIIDGNLENNLIHIKAAPKVYLPTIEERFIPNQLKKLNKKTQ